MDITEVLSPVRDLGAFIRTQRIAAQISVRQLARQAGVSNPYLSQVERGLRRPSAEILAQIAHGLQISVESLLTMAGILDEPTVPAAPTVPTVPVDSGRPLPSVVASINADPVLSDRQKASLLDIYQAFCRDSAPRTDAAPAVDPELPALAAPITTAPITTKPAISEGE